MRILILGNGGREHAIAQALHRDPKVTELFIAPGNPGTAQIGQNVAVSLTSAQQVVGLAQDKAVDLVVIGPEEPLVLGIADALREAGIPVFGPSAQAAQIEGSKAFAKDVMHKANVRTAHCEILDSLADLDSALERFGPTWVVKDDGLSAGKGVVVTDSIHTARSHASGLLESGRPVLLESFLDGPEISLFSFVSGETVVPLLPAQDSKRLNDNDRGPNTGGMGAYAPTDWVSSSQVEYIVENIVKPVAKELSQRGTPFTGLLYAGLAIGAQGPAVVEFNCRFGDPETQAVLELLKTPLSDVLMATAQGTLQDLPPLEWFDGSAIAVVVAAQSYPSKPRAGDVIEGLDEVKAPARVVHAGTKRDDKDNIITAGGRVLAVTATGDSLRSARESAYENLAKIKFPGLQYRKDIGKKAADNALSHPWEY